MPDNIKEGFIKRKMAKLKNKEESKLYRKYHIPGCGNLSSVKLNAIFITKKGDKGYTYEHEKAKFDLAWEARTNKQNFLTEAERRASDEEAKMFKLRTKKKIVDFVNLSIATEYEIIHKHETDEMIEFYRQTGIVPILVDPMLCESCFRRFPKRVKKNICQICRRK